MAVKRRDFPKAVLFDFFGTLSRGVRTRRESIAVALGCDEGALNGVMAESFYERATGRYGDEIQTMNWIAQQVGISVTDEQLRAAVAAHSLAQRGNFALRVDATAVLQNLRSGGLLVGIVSDCTHDLVSRWDELGIADLVDARALSIEVGVCKPDPQIYLHATHALQVLPGDCVYVGDGASHELTGAARLGMTPIRLRVDPSEEHVSYRQDEVWSGCVIDSLSELLTLGWFREIGTTVRKARPLRDP
jgi:putative hydrolase of the HAD superfamily